jgi:Cytochrome c
VKKASLTAGLAVVAAVAIMLIQYNSAARRGERAFTRLGCTGCHFSGAGPNLTHVLRKHDRKLLEQFILDPQSVYKQRNREPLNRGYMLMPRMQVTSPDVHDILAYLADLNQNQEQ